MKPPDICLGFRFFRVLDRLADEHVRQKNAEHYCAGIAVAVGALKNFFDLQKLNNAEDATEQAYENQAGNQFAHLCVLLQKEIVLIGFG